MTIPKQAKRRFSVVSYLAAVAGGCLLTAMLSVFWDPLIAGKPIKPSNLLIAALAGMMPGSVLGLLICLPGTLLSFTVANRFGLYSLKWYGALGAMVGLINPILLVGIWFDYGNW